MVVVTLLKLHTAIPGPSMGHAHAGYRWPGPCAEYVAEMGTHHNVRKCACATTTKTASVVVQVDLDGEASPWVRLDAKEAVPYLGLQLNPYCDYEGEHAIVGKSRQLAQEHNGGGVRVP